jgi:hypothetical protein
MVAPMSTPSHIGTLDYLVEVAKDWTVNSFAQARDSDFAFTAHRFVLDDHTVRRRAIRRGSREASNPLQAVGRPRQPIAWARGEVATFLVDTQSGAVDFEQEVVEILAVEGDDVLAETAVVVRILGLPPCLGPFSAVA